MTRLPRISDLQSWIGPQLTGQNYNNNNADIITILTSGNFDVELGTINCNFLYGDISHATGFPSTDLTLAAGEDIALGDLVRISGGQFFKAINTSDAGITDVYGFAITSVTSGGQVTARNGNISFLPITVSVGATYYVSNTAGQITSSKPTSRAKYVGVGSSNNILIMTPQLELSPTFPYINVSNSSSLAASTITSLKSSVVAKTTTYTATSTDYSILCSGSAFTVTLPAASSNPGQILVLTKTDASLTNIITIARAGSDTINGGTSTTLNTQNESITIQSDGTSNWQILSRAIPFSWQNTTTTITGTTSNPSKGTVLTDKFWYRRVGGDLEFRIEFSTSVAGGDGSGDYLFALPSGYAIDTSAVTVNTTLGGSTSQFSFGDGISRNGTTDSQVGICVPYDSTHFRILYSIGTSGNTRMVGAGQYGLATTNLTYAFRGRIPISGWNS